MSDGGLISHPSDGPDARTLWTEFGQAHWRASRRIEILRAREFIKERGERWAPPGWAGLAREDPPEIEVLRAPFARAFDLSLPVLHEPPRTSFEPDLLGLPFAYIAGQDGGRLTPILQSLTLTNLLTCSTRSHCLLLRLVHVEVAPPGPRQPWTAVSLPHASETREGAFIVFHDPRWTMVGEEARIGVATDAAGAIATARDFAAAHRVAACVGEVLHAVSVGW